MLHCVGVCNYQLDFYIDSILCFVPSNKDIKTWILPFTRNYLRRLMSLSLGWHKNSVWFRGMVTFWKPHQKYQWVLNQKHSKLRFWSPELCFRIKLSVRCEYWAGLTLIIVCNSLNQTVYSGALSRINSFILASIRFLLTFHFDFDSIFVGGFSSTKHWGVVNKFTE